MAINNKDQYTNNLKSFASVNGINSVETRDFSTAAYGGEIGSTTYANKLLESLNLTCKQASDESNSAVVVNCQITEIPKNADSNVYKVTYQGNSNLTAITSSKSIIYEVGQSVSVIVPEGNFENDLIIIGLYSSPEETIISEEDYFEQVSPNLIKDQQTEIYSLTTWAPGTSTITLTDVQSQLLWNSIFKEDNKLCFSVDVLTQIEEQYRGQGNYGLKIKLPIKTTSAEGEQEITNYSYQDIVVFDTYSMLGNPYSYDVKSNQKFYIDLDPEIQYVDYAELTEHPVKFEIFVDDTWTYPTDYSTTKIWDVQFSNLQIYEVRPVPEEYQNGYYFILTAPEDGTLFVQNTNSIKLIPLLRYRMKEVLLNSDDYLCYWFRKNSSIKSDSGRYLPIGGRGWEVLNKVSEDDENEYIDDEFEYSVKSSEVYLEGTYKCVLIPKTGLKEDQVPTALENGYFEAELALTKKNAGIKIDLTSDSQGITCSATSTVTLEAYIEYQASEEPVIDFNFSRYNQDGKFIEDSFGEIVSVTTQKETGQTTNLYKITQKYKFSAGIISSNSFNTILCSFRVLNGSGQFQDIGDASLIIKTGDSDKFILNTYGEAFYKYDNYGNAPTLATYAGSGNRVVQIKPVSFDIINANGKLFANPEDYVGWTFTWGFPKNSLIKVDVDQLRNIYNFSEDDNYYYFSKDQYSLSEISYEIENRFDKTKAENNAILLNVTNGTENLVGNVQITFTKDGLAGTNGSSYSAVVVASVTNPNISDISVPGTQKSLGTWPMNLEDKGYEYGELVSRVKNLPAKLQAFYYNENWYFFFPNWMSQFKGNNSANFWINNDYLSAEKAVPTFKVKVMKEGKEIAEAVTPNHSTTNGYTVEWSMMTNSDARGFNSDANVSVNFDISNNGVLSVKDSSTGSDWDDNNKVFFNIVQAKIKVANTGLVGEKSNFEYLYAYYPIEITKIDNIAAFPTGDKVEVFPQLSGGFDEVIYRSDGVEPVYTNDENFTLSNYNDLSDDKDLFNYTWTTSRNLYLNNDQESQQSFNDDATEHTDSIHNVTRIIKPVSNFDNGINANYVKVNYGYDQVKKTEMVTQKNNLNNEISNLKNKWGYISIRTNALNDKLLDLRDLSINYGKYFSLYDKRYSLMQKIVLSDDKLLDVDFTDTNSIKGYNNLIIQFLDKYCKMEVAESKYHQLKGSCTTLTALLVEHYTKLKLLNENNQAIQNLSHIITLPFVDFDDSDFNFGVHKRDLFTHIERCNSLISEYNTLFSSFKNNSDLINSFSELNECIVEAIDSSSFTTTQTITYQGTEISVKLDSDYNPVETDLVNQNSTDYFINTFLIPALTGYSNLYSDALTWLDTKNLVIRPLLDLISKTANYSNVYTEYLTQWDTEIEDKTNEVLDLENKIQYIEDNQSSSIIHIKPILFITNTAEFGMLHGWDGTSATTFDDDTIGECVYQPQVGAGQWDPQTNSFKGLILGLKKFVDSDGTNHFMRGMFGYGPNQQGGSGSQQTLLLNSDTGQMILGDRFASRITIDPQRHVQKLDGTEETVGTIYSGNFYKDYKLDGTWMPDGYEFSNEAHAGMMIDLTSPEIRFGNGNFELDSLGNLYASGTGRIAAWTLSDYSLSSKNNTKSSNGNEKSLTLLSGKRAIYWKTTAQSTDPINSLNDLDLNDITYDYTQAKKDSSGQPMAVLIKTVLQEGNRTANRTVLRKAYLDDPYNVPAIYSNTHSTLSDNNNIGFYLSQEGLSILGKYYTDQYDSLGVGIPIEAQKVADPRIGYEQTSRLEINTTDKPKIYSGRKNTFEGKQRGFYIGDDGISLYNDKYYIRATDNSGAYEVVNINGTNYNVYSGDNNVRIVRYFNDDPQYNRYEFRIIDSNNQITTTTRLPNYKGGGIFLNVNGLEMPSLYSKSSNSLSDTSDGFYLSDCGISLGRNFKVTKNGVAYIGYNAAQDGGSVTNGKFWTINGDSSKSYISYNTNYLVGNGYTSSSVFLGTNGLRIGRTFLVDVDNNELKMGNLNTNRYWVLKGDSGNAYLAYNCVGQNGTNSDLGSCIYQDEATYRTNSSGSKYVTSLAYRINGASPDPEDDPAEEETDNFSPDSSQETETTGIDDDRVSSNTDTEDSDVTTYYAPRTKAVYVGTNGIRIGRHFAVNPQGEAVLKAGTIGNWTINNNKIFSVLTPYNKNTQRKIEGKKYLIELDAKEGLSCYQLNYKSEAYYKVTPSGNENPQALGWYIKDGNNYILTTDTYVRTGVDYYEQGQRWKKKTQWYVKTNGRAYFRKLQIKKGEENYIDLNTGTVGNFTVSPSGLSGGSISSATSITGSSCSFNSATLGTTSSTTLTVNSTSSFGGEISAYNGTTKCIDLVPNTDWGISLTSFGCYVGPVSNGGIAESYKVMTRKEVADLINAALASLKVTYVKTNVNVDYIENEETTEVNDHKHKYTSTEVTPEQTNVTVSVTYTEVPETPPNNL